MDNSFFNDLEDIINLENLNFINLDTHIPSNIKNYQDLSTTYIILENNLLKY